MKEIHIFAMAAQGIGISGGDRIFIEFARRWQKDAKVYIYSNEEGREMCRRQNLDEGSKLKYVIWQTGFWKNFGFVITYFSRILRAIMEAMSLNLPNNKRIAVYSASEFWMDSLPGIILKIRFPKIIWAASWYQTAPNPIKGFSEGKREKSYNFSAFLYWFVQILIKPFIEKYADCILINNEEERKQFPKFNRKLIIVLGAVDVEKIEKWRKKNGNFNKEYDAVFQGRFHPQKGVVELIDIWGKVVKKIPSAKLAMIGDGPLMGDVEKKIKFLKLKKNVVLLGYVFDGDKKYQTFSKGKIVVHPALYDSGGMASAEAMAFGLPVVGFDLKAYKSYYPKGMVKVEIGNLNKFANAVLDLLKNNIKRKKMAASALSMIRSSWSWDKRARETVQAIFS